MQFITSGDRIAVENFTLGDLYTITFTNGNYINSACIGIGENFVTFQRNEPELLFTLNMETAELVSSIDLYAGGTGTNNYNELTNKPQIGGVELVGNKSLSDLGIQSEITAESPLSASLISGLGSAAAAESSDFATAAQGALAASAVQPAAMEAALALKQDALSAAQLAAVDSGITDTDVAQITTNKNNILSLWDNGAKNHYKITSTQTTTGITYTKISESELSINGTFSESTYVYFNLTANNFRLPAGTWKFRFTTTGTVPNRSITFGVQGQGSTTASKDTDYEFTTTGAEYLTAYVQFLTNDTVNGSIRIMVRPANISDPNYQPYALSNVELTQEKISEYTAPTTITLAIAETYEGGTVYNGYCGNDFPSGLAGLYVAITTHKSGNPSVSRIIQDFVFQNGERKSRYYNGTWTALV